MSNVSETKSFMIILNFENNQFWYNDKNFIYLDRKNSNFQWDYNIYDMYNIFDNKLYVFNLVVFEIICI